MAVIKKRKNPGLRWGIEHLDTNDQPVVREKDRACDIPWTENSVILRPDMVVCKRRRRIGYVEKREMGVWYLNAEERAQCRIWCIGRGPRITDITRPGRKRPGNNSRGRSGYPTPCGDGWMSVRCTCGSALMVVPELTF